MPLTPHQEQAVHCAGTPLFIQAGAGTGKTFTLTKRLAYGLSQGSGPLIPSVDNVLTITFTNKAAAELLGRVRAELRAQGLADAALRIDGAWISTIHGMCSSILSAHALEAGIDPGVGMLSSEESEQLLHDAVDELLHTPEFDSLAAVYGTSKACGFVSDLASLVAMAPEGVASYDLGPQVSIDPLRIARGLAESLEGYRETLVKLGAGQSGKLAPKRLEILEETLAALKDELETGELCWQSVCDVLGTRALPKHGGIKNAIGECLADASQAIIDVYLLANAAASRERLELALALAQKAAVRHGELKAALGMQDTNDLLMGTYRLLTAHPEIAEEYRERFASIMVDEFQDTDILQVRIIESFCDERLSTLTTVGDAQQSIYGFRGADLETYRAVRSQMAQAGSQEVSLDTNYRSHPDILAFVESIFSKPGFFGDEFLFIGAGPNNARAYSWAPEGEPRIQLLTAVSEKSPDGKKRTPVDVLRKAEAELIAEKFQSLHAAGASYGDMAILMGSAKKAGPYMRAMRSRGIPCAVSGGSDLYAQPEVQLMVSLLRVLELPDDDRPLLEVLASPLFDLPDGDLLSLRLIARRELRNPGPEDIRPKISLWDALRYQAKRLPAGRRDPLVNAYSVLSEGLNLLGELSLRATVERILESCGWLEELRADGTRGQAVLANVRRFCDLLEEFELRSGPSIVLASENFRALAEDGAKAGLGRMVGLGQDSVQIMTIHSSKGLEFPIVAVCNYERSGGGADDKVDVDALTEDGRRYLAMPMGLAEKVKKSAKEAMEESQPGSFANACDAVAFNQYAQDLQTTREMEERQRLLYVALTRARDMLFLVSNATLKDGVPNAELLGGIIDAVDPEGLQVGIKRKVLDTGCLVELETVSVPFGEAEDKEDDTLTEQRVHTMVEAPEHRELSRRRGKRARAIGSYSSLSHAEEADVADGTRPDFVPAPVLKERGASVETVSPVGSAFHLCAQWVALQRAPREVELADGRLAARMAAAAKRYRLQGEDRRRLEDAMEQWLDSSRFAQVCTYPKLFPEHAFCVKVGDEVLEGFIDLLCLEGGNEKALIIDYKTGTSGMPEELRDRYQLQAAVYASAVLRSGLASAVELAFVRPEANLQEVVYNYSLEDVAALERLICNQGKPAQGDD